MLNSCRHHRRMALTSVELKLLREATSVSFHHGTLASGDTVARIRLHDERRLLGGNDNELSFDFVSEIEVASAVRSYRRDVRNELHNCFHMLHAASMSRRWQTVVSSLRPGDELALQWVHANDSDSLRKAGFHADELALVVQRHSTNFEHLIAYQCGPPTAASMVRAGRVGDTGSYRWSRVDADAAMDVAALLIDAVPRRRRVVVAVAEDLAPDLSGRTEVLTRRGPVDVVWRADAALDEDRLALLDARCTRVLIAAWVPPRQVSELGAPATTLYGELRSQGHRSATAAETVVAALR